MFNFIDTTSLLFIDGGWQRYCIILIFLIINGLIVYNDLRYKKIPNKYLLIIILIFGATWYLYEGSHIDADWFFGVSLACITGFGVYLFNGWAPGDAKYFIVLCLFLDGGFDTIRFIGNISTISLLGIAITMAWTVLKKYPERHAHQSNKKEGVSKKRVGGSAQLMKGIYFLMPLFGFFFCTIFLRESLFGHAQILKSFGIDIAILLFIALLIMRLIQDWIASSRDHNELGKKQFLLIAASSVPIIFGILYKGPLMWYYLRDILLYVVPTAVLISLLIHKCSKLLRKEERMTIAYRDLGSSEVPLCVLLKGEMIRVKTREEIDNLCKAQGQIIDDVSVVIGRSHPFGHYIFLGFLLTAFSSAHLAHYILSHWYFFLSDFWGFIGRFL